MQPPEMPPPVRGLRERQKAATMHRVQTVALDLFDEHGFDRVTVAQVAHVAEVSESTVYRHFKTKEGIVLHDEHDDAVLPRALALMLEDDLDLRTILERALEGIEEEHFERDAELTYRRMGYFTTVPAVRAAGLVVVDEYVHELAHALVEHGRRDVIEAHAVAAAIIWAYITAAEAWYESGGHEPIGAMLRRGIGAVADLE